MSAATETISADTPKAQTAANPGARDANGLPPGASGGGDAGRGAPLGAEVAAPRRRLPLAWRIFLASAALIVLALGAAVFVTWRQGQAIAQEAVDRALAASVETQREFGQGKRGEIELTTQLVAADPAFVQYVSGAQGGNLGLGNDGVPDGTSIVDLLRERQATHGFDLGIVLDTEGKVLARTDSNEAVDASLAGDPFVEPVLAELTPVSGFWRQGDALYMAALMPLAQKDDLTGFLILGDRIDDAVAAQVGRVSGADIAFFLPTPEGRPALIGSSLAPADREALAAAIAAGQGAVQAALAEGRAMERVPSLTFGGREWTGQFAPLDVDAGARLGGALSLFSTDRAIAGYRELLNLLVLVALIALLIALPVSFLLAKAALRPLDAMASAAQDAAEGDYGAKLAVAGNDPLARLSRAFDQLLGALREKRDIESYVGNLARYLPDPAQDAPPVIAHATKEQPVPPAERARRLLLGVDLRGFAKSPEIATADETVAAFNERAVQVEHIARDAGASLIATGATRFTFAFEGEGRLGDALYAVREVLLADQNAATALIDGEVITGTVITSAASSSTAIGPGSYQLDRLLAESSAGRVLLPRGLGDAAKSLVGEANVSVVQGVVSGKPFYSVPRAALSTLPRPKPRAVEPAAATKTSPPPRGRGDDLALGSRFGGRYDILSVLGSGGMGVVYKARDIELDDVVALKMLKPAALADREHLERLKSEIKLARRITHPNVLRTFDFGESEGRPYISMEYVRGMTLRYLIKQAGRIPYSAGLRIARQLCAGLAAAHEVGVLHRDIKPENLILEQSGNAKLMDFGIARPLARIEPGHTAPGMFVGTPHYCSPEQLAGAEVDARADIYASGVLLCEMFSGHLPYSGDSTMEIYLAQLQKEPVRPSTHWPEIPPGLEAIILKCIAREPSARYQSADELAAALDTLRA